MGPCHGATESLDLPHCQTSTAAQFGALVTIYLLLPAHDWTAGTFKTPNITKLTILKEKMDGEFAHINPVSLYGLLYFYS